MNAYKLQCEALKALLKNPKSFGWDEHKENIVFTFDSVSVYILPKSDWYISADDRKMGLVKHFFTKLDGLQNAYLMEMRTWNPDGKKEYVVQKVESEDKTMTVWVNAKILESYGKNVTVSLLPTSGKFPLVYIFDGTECVGMTLPTRYTG